MGKKFHYYSNDFYCKVAGFVFGYNMVATTRGGRIVNTLRRGRRSGISLTSAKAIF